MTTIRVNSRLLLKLALVLVIGMCTIGGYSQSIDEISIVITFENAPSDVSAVKAPLKYNKRFALSMQIDNGNNSIYHYGFPVFGGGVVGSTTYPGMNYSDGCNNPHSFKMTSAIFIFSGIGTDVHNDPGGEFVTWQQLDTLCQNHWGVGNRGVNSDMFGSADFINYSIARNQSYTQRKMYKSKPGGVITKVFVNPGGNSTWTVPAFDLGNICALNENNGGPFGNFGGNVNDTLVNWFENKYSLFRINPGNQDITDLVDSVAAKSVGGANYWSPIYTPSCYDDYMFNTFVNDFNYIQNTYGSNGTDEILMTTDEEILDYLIVRDAISVNSNLLGKKLTLTFNGSLPNDLLYYSTSIVINSNEIIADITVEGTDDFTFSNVGDISALINLNWDEYIIASPEIIASNYTLTAVTSQTEYDALIAMDYVSVLEYGEVKNNLVTQLCEISGVIYDEGFCSSGYPDFVVITGDSIILTGEEAVLTATDFMERYLWSTGQVTQSITVSPQSNSKYWVESITKEGAVVSDTILVTVSDSYIVDNSPLYIDHIPGVVDSLWVTLKEGAASLWSTGSVLNYIIVDPSVSTVYHLDVLLDGKVVNKLDYVVYVENVLEFTFNSVCFGDTTVLINTSVVNDSITKILWDLNGNTQFDDAEGDTVSYVFSETGNHLVGMRVYFSTDPMDVVYNAVPVGDKPNVDFEFTNACAESITYFSDLSTVQVGVLDNWFWRFGDGKTDGGQNTSNYYNDQGNYNVMLIAWSSFGCKDSLQKIVQIAGGINIVLKTSYDSIIANNDTVYFEKGETVTVVVSNFTSYDSVIWFDGDRSESVIIAEEGSYYVNAYKNGCSSRQDFHTAWGNAPEPPPSGKEIMNLFTPNGDGYNDLWQINDPKIISPAKVNIYNRSGKQIYSSSNYQNNWDGQFEGNPLPQATYYYIIEDASGQLFKGAVTIIR